MVRRSSRCLGILKILAFLTLFFLLTPLEAAAWYGSDIVDGVNAERQANGLSMLTWNQELANAGMNHVNDMAEKGYFSHVSLNNQNPTARAWGFGYKGWYVGEALARGTAEPEGMVVALLASESHRKVLRMGVFTEIGVGVVLRDGVHFLAIELGGNNG